MHTIQLLGKRMVEYSAYVIRAEEWNKRIFLKELRELIRSYQHPYSYGEQEEVKVLETVLHRERTRFEEKYKCLLR